MRMRVFKKKLRVEIENEMRVFLETLDFEIEMRVSQKSGGMCGKRVMVTHLVCVLCLKRVMAVQVYTVLAFFSKQIITYFLSKIAD